ARGAIEVAARVVASGTVDAAAGAVALISSGPTRMPLSDVLVTLPWTSAMTGTISPALAATGAADATAPTTALAISTALTVAEPDTLSRHRRCSSTARRRPAICDGRAIANPPNAAAPTMCVRRATFSR